MINIPDSVLEFIAKNGGRREPPFFFKKSKNKFGRKVFYSYICILKFNKHGYT